MKDAMKKAQELEKNPSLFQKFIAELKNEKKPTLEKISNITN